MVSVLFCDVVGFTAASDGADPEDVRLRMEAYYARLRPVVESFGGTVEKYIGDAVMAVFGAPVAHEDDAERAVRTGLAILEAVVALNEADPSDAVAVRVGVNTGEVVIDVGDRADGGIGLVLGDTVNTAARIQAAAPVGAVTVGAGTHRQTERVFEYAPLEPLTAKGKSEPIAVWHAVAPRARLGSDVIRTLSTPLVGRGTELEALTGALEEVLRTGSPRVVTVVAEAGVGKSRLVAELRAYAGRIPVQVLWRQGRCLPYGNGITFWALAEIVKAHAGIYDADPVDVATAKLDAVLPDTDEGPWLRSRLLPLLGIETGEATQEELFAAWRRWLELTAEREPVVS